MNTDNDTPCSAADRAAIIAAAKDRVGYLQMIAELLQEPRYSQMTYLGQQSLRKAAAHELMLMVEGCS